MLLIANQPQNSHPIPNRMLNEQKQPTGFKYNMCRFHKQLELEDKADIDGNSALLGDHLLLLALFALMGRRRHIWPIWERGKREGPCV